MPPPLAHARSLPTGLCQWAASLVRPNLVHPPFTVSIFGTLRSCMLHGHMLEVGDVLSLSWSVIGDAGEAIALAPPGSCVAMEASVAGLPSDALKAIDDVGTIDRLDASSLAVCRPCQMCCVPVFGCISCNCMSLSMTAAPCRVQAYVGGEVTASGRTAVPLPEVQEEVFDLSALEALAAQGARLQHWNLRKWPCCFFVPFIVHPAVVDCKSRHPWSWVLVIWLAQVWAHPRPVTGMTRRSQKAARILALVLSR